MRLRLVVGDRWLACLETKLETGAEGRDGK